MKESLFWHGARPAWSNRKSFGLEQQKIVHRSKKNAKKKPSVGQAEKVFKNAGFSPIGLGQAQKSVQKCGF